MKVHIEYDDFGEYVEILEDDMLMQVLDPHLLEIIRISQISYQ